jgi:hypothetical protein
MTLMIRMDKSGPCEPRNLNDRHDPSDGGRVRVLVLTITPHCLLCVLG